MAAHRAAFSRYQHHSLYSHASRASRKGWRLVEALRRQIASCVQAPQILCDRRYPYLDRTSLSSFSRFLQINFRDRASVARSCAGPSPMSSPKKC